MRMSEEDYKYLSQPADDDPLLELIHIIADISILCEKTDYIHASHVQVCEDFLSRRLSQKEKQMNWYSRWEEKIGGRPSTYNPGHYPCSLPMVSSLLTCYHTDDLFFCSL